jgi:hypothetical protein
MRRQQAKASCWHSTKWKRSMTAACLQRDCGMSPAPTTSCTIRPYAVALVPSCLQTNRTDAPGRAAGPSWNACTAAVTAARAAGSSRSNTSTQHMPGPQRVQWPRLSAGATAAPLKLTGSGACTPCRQPLLLPSPGCWASVLCLAAHQVCTNTMTYTATPVCVVQIPNHS